MATRKVEPEAGPATVGAVAGWLGAGTESPEMEHIALVVPAVNALLSGWISRDADTGKWSEQAKMGAVMLAARVTRRRNSPGGVEALTEMGTAYVSRYDPDLDRLLKMGSWRDLVVG